MKITYIIEVDPAVHSGINKKIENQTGIWRKKGHKVQLLILWPRAKQKGVKFLEGSYYSHSLLDRLPRGFLNTYLTKIFKIGSLAKDLKHFEPDLVYIRQNIWYPGLPNVLRKYKTVMELNTVDYMEMNYYSVLKKKVYLWGKDRLLSSVSGLLAVSPAILEHYGSYTIPQKVVANGIDLSKFKPLPPAQNEEPTKLIFVGSANMYWHGLDKIIELARKLPEYTFNIVGYEIADLDQELPKNVNVHGWLDSNQLTALYRQCSVGLGSFGNHRVGKPIDSTLKVLEYLAYGLPVIMGHKDVDFYNAKFVLKATDDKHNLIDLEVVKSFIESYKDKRVASEEIKQVDSFTKEKERLQFFKTVLTKHQN